MIQARTQLLLQQMEINPGEKWESRCAGWFFGRVSKGYCYSDQAKESRVAASGELLVAAPEAPLCLRANRLAGVVIHYFVFRPEGMGDLLPPEDMRQIRLWAAGQPIGLHHFPAQHPLARQFAQICQAATKQLFAPFHLLPWIAELFSQPPAPAPAKEAAGATCSARLEQLICELRPEELLEHSPSELARNCGCSLRHLRRLFRNQFGQSLREKQLELRMQKASRLLAQPQLKVLHVALESGYHHIGLFNAHFKRRYGMTPSQWRERHRQAPAKSAGMELA